MILCWTGINLILKSFMLFSPCGILSEFWRVHCLHREHRELAFELSLTKWVLCTFVTRAWKSQVLASHIEKGQVPSHLYGNRCGWVLVHPSGCPISSLLSLPGAAKQQVQQGTALGLALWAVCSWDLDVDCPGGHLTVLYFSAPRFSKAVPCQLTQPWIRGAGCGFPPHCTKDRALTLAPTALLLWSAAGRRVLRGVPALIWSEGPVVSSLLGTAGCGAVPWNCLFLSAGNSVQEHLKA